MTEEIELTQEEAKAIRSLQRLAKKWPKSLELFAANSSLIVCKDVDYQRYGIETILNIQCAGGDPDEETLCTDVDAIWP